VAIRSLSFPLALRQCASRAGWQPVTL